MKALVVAERPIDRIVLGRFVALAGIGVVEAELANAAEALHRIVPALLIIDAGDDNNHHRSILSAIDQSKRPLVLVIASERPVAQHLAGDPDIDAAICKPLTTDKVVPAVHELLDQHSAR